MPQSPILAYLDTVTPDHRDQLTDLYTYLHSLLPGATEKISYSMPAFFVDGKPVIYFAAMKHHIGLYPTAAPIAHFAAELAAYKTSKGAVQLPYGVPLPTNLIMQLVTFRIAQIRTGH